MKKYLLFASAILAFASCANDSYLGTEDEKHIADGDQAITFGFDMQRATRAESTGATAAGKLSNQFVVYAEKNETDGTAPAPGNLVIKNYVVNYVTNSAYTSTSNTKDWEYVGFKFDDASATIPTTSYSTNITPNSGADVVQTIKFWDDAASSYTFTAVSALPADIQNGRVKITKTTSGTNQYAKGYSLTLTKTTESGNDTYPDLTHLYFADRKNIAKGDGYNHSVVTMNFRNVLSHVRVGIYETIPGYRISAITFYNQESTPVEYQKSSTSAFGAVCPNYTSNFVGTLTVTYGDDNSGHMNEPIVSANGTGTAATDLILGTNFNSLTVGSTDPSVAAKFLGEDATNATYDTDGGTYTAVMPQTAGSNLKLKVNYTLYNTITKETINITGKTAEVPAEYLNWKANYKYTYLFKITDDGLNPITFDAAVIEDAVGNAEYITTVSEPSITTFGVIVNSSDAFKNYVTEKNEYQIPTTASTDKLDIYATFMNGNSVGDFTIGTNVNVYKVTSTNETTFPITEASVANSLANPTGNNITCKLKNSDGSTSFGAAPSRVTTVPGEDGSSKTINALKLTGVKESGTYAVEYTPIEQASGTYVSGTTYYTDNTGATTVDTSGFTPGTTDVSSYFVKSTTKKAYKVIKVVVTP